MFLYDDNHWMGEALKLAASGEERGEVPVGAVVVYQNEIIGRGYNQSIELHDPTAHAEIQAIREAANTLKNYRLNDCSLYVTLEPCAMCAGGMVHARISRLVFGASDPKTGACGSVMQLTQHGQLNHQIPTTSGVMAEACSTILKNFFKRRREEQS